jgi:hypothetical protein
MGLRSPAWKTAARGWCSGLATWVIVARGFGPVLSGGPVDSGNVPSMTSAASLSVEELSADLVPYLSLLGALRTGASVDGEYTRLVEAAVEVWRRPGFDTFLSQPRLGFEPFDYQWQTAQTVLRRMRGRAILADEVGLGKTIEAGIVLKEYLLRGRVASALVLVPPSLSAAISSTSTFPGTLCASNSGSAVSTGSARSTRWTL